MKRLPRIVLLAILIIGTLAFAAIAQAPSDGCCCNLTDGTAQRDSEGPQSECNPAYTGFIVPTTTDYALGKTCNTICGEVAEIPEIIVGQCGAPGFQPAPANLSVFPVKGRHVMNLEWNAICPADAYEISRCEGVGCTDFQLLGIIPSSTSYQDGSPELLWNTVYTYEIIAKYSIQDDSNPSIGSGGTGDLECENQFIEGSFCVSEFSYNPFRSYLEANGYAGTPQTDADTFEMNFDSTVNSVFFIRFNKAFSCDADNLLTEETSCGADAFCVSYGADPSCITPGPCDPFTGLFGLGATEASCEGVSPDTNYCFFDRSATSVDSCYECTQDLTCYDYKSAGACGRNNCGLGQCEWRDTFADIGAGVCVDSRFNNCALCTDEGTPGAPNQGSYNLIVDQCSPDKAAQLSSTDFPCFFGGPASVVDCDTITCNEYTAGQCGTPSGGITLNPDNSIATPSNDPCNIGVCQSAPFSPIPCRKNANATPLVDEFWPDCNLNNRTCELDYFPPMTTMIPIGGAGRFDYLDIRIWDRRNVSDFGHLITPPPTPGFGIGALGVSGPQEVPGWNTFLCAYGSDETTCTNFVSVSSTQLNLNDRDLQNGQDVLFTMVPGWNVLRYYTQDLSKNLEIIQELNVFSCTACQGPKALVVNITPGNQIGNTYYVRSLTPMVHIEYNEPAEQIFAGFVKGSESIELDKTPSSGFNFNYDFDTPSDLDEELWTFSANARDSNNVLMDAPLEIPVEIDITPPTASYSPIAGEVLGSDSVTIEITFNERILIQNFTIEEFRVYNTSQGPVRVLEPRVITPLFTTTDNMTYTAQLTLTEGRKIIRPLVTDFAGNPLALHTNSSEFIINVGAPIITIVEPSSGFSSEFTFDMVFETDSAVECRYWSSQFVPPPNPFSALSQFDSTNGFLHTKLGFSEITEEDKPHKVFVRCIDSDTGEGTENFFIVVDQSEPEIITAYASPSTIVQRPLKTVLKVQTDDRTFCKYSRTTQNYDLMEGEFPWFNILGLFSHAANVSVPQPGDYTYNVACKNLAGIGPDTADIDFDVDLDQTFKITSVTPEYFGSTRLPLSVETNKDSFCFYASGGSLKVLGNANRTAMAHTEIVNLPGEGWHTIPVSCSTPAGISPLGVEFGSINITVFIDLSPPFMLYVDDTSNHPDFPEISYFLNMLRLAFLGADNETNVSRYYYRIENQATNEPIVDWTPSVRLDGLPWWVTGLNLTDGEAYYFRVKPENRAGLEGNELPSDGVTIDITKIPPYCRNQLFDTGNETDVDCGNACLPCGDFKTCAEDYDCLSRICNSSMICQPSLCDDITLGGNETDIDCGGNVCDSCDNGLICADHSDCQSNYCNSGICDDNPCFNQLLDGLESDIDCGGICFGCMPGQSCVFDDDCANNGTCDAGICATTADADDDGVTDDLDICPNTRFGQPVNEFGCSAEQTFSCGDQIDDAWRLRYFNEILCDGDGAPDADPDGDGRTNLEEYLAGTDPTESDKAPFPWLLLIIILLILIALGVVGWYLYKHPKVKKAKAKKPAPKKVPKAPVPAKKAPTTPLKKAPHVEDWVSMKELKKLGPQDMSTKTFNKLDSLIQGTLPKHEHAKLLKQMVKEKSPIDKLRKLALKGLSAKEKIALLEQLKLLRKGKLTKAQIDKLFRKLRITASYYRTHRNSLEGELAAFARGEKVKRRKK